MNRAIIVITLVFFVNISFADTVYMNDGSTIKGLVVEDHCDRIVFSTYEGEKAILKNDIDEIFFDDLEQNYYYIANKFVCELDFERAEKFYDKALDVNGGFKPAIDGISRMKDVRTKSIKKWDDTKPLDMLREKFGISLSQKGDFSAVSEVIKKRSPFSKEDAISAVWDESMRFTPPDEVAKKMAGLAGTSVKVVIRRDVVFCSRCVPWYLAMFGIKREGVLPVRMEIDGLTVGGLAPASLAHRSGLKTGDRIVAIDSRPTRYMPLKEAKKLIHKDIPQEVILTIERDLMLER